MPRLVLDANILYSETLTDVFLAFAHAGLATIVWSDRLREEWTLALVRNRPDLDAHWHAARSCTLRAARNWTSVTVDAVIVETLSLPDPDDRHVLAAAIQSAATAIVTSNLRDFPRRTLDRHGISAATADAIVCRLIESYPEAAAGVLQPLTSEIHLERLRRAGLARTVKTLRKWSEERGCASYPL